MRTQRLIAYAFAACLVSLLAGTAMADDGSGHFNAFLQGQYQVSGTVTCSTGPTVELIGSEPTLFDTFTGVITYDGHGHATLKDQGVDIGTGSPDRFDDETTNIVMRWPATVASPKRVAARMLVSRICYPASRRGARSVTGVRY